MIHRIRRTANLCTHGLLAVLVMSMLALVPFGARASAGEAPAASHVLPTITGPLSLEDAVRAALKYNPTVQAASHEASAAGAQVGMARAMTRPQLSVTGTASTATMEGLMAGPPHVMPSSITAFPDTSAATGRLMLMYPIYTGGRLSAGVNGSEALFGAATSERAVTEQNVALEAKVAYHHALLAQAFIEVYRNLVTEERERVRIAEVAFREGKIAKYDLLRNQADLANAEQQLENSKRDAEVAMIDLKTALGIAQESDLTLVDGLAYTPVVGGLDAFVERAAQNRPELAAVRARVVSAQSEVKVAKSAFKPHIYLNAMQGVIAASGGDKSGYTVGITASIPLVDGGLRSAAVKQARSMLEARKRDEQQALLSVRQDVHTVWAEMQAADRNVKLSEAAVAQAREDYRVVKLRYEAGKAINVEVLDALFALVRAQTNHLSALYDHNIARDRLARAIGEL